MSAKNVELTAKVSLEPNLPADMLVHGRDERDHVVFKHDPVALGHMVLEERVKSIIPDSR